MRIPSIRPSIRPSIHPKSRRWRLRQLAPEGNDPLGAMRCAQAATARMAKGSSVGGPGDSEDNCVERNAIRTIRVGEMRRAECDSYRAEQRRAW